MMNIKKIQIGTVGESYTHRRNFSGLNLDEVNFKRAYDLLTVYRYLNRLTWFKKRFASEKLKNMHWDIGLGNYDMFHFFHGVSNSKKPWFSSFSTALPRWGVTQDGVQMLESRSCKKLIALSECAYNIQSRRLKNTFPASHDKIMAKTIVVHPPQKRNIETWADKNIDFSKEIRFVLVGNHFFRKGGMEILEVFEELKQYKAKTSLTIISNLGYGDYASFTTIEDQKNAREIIERNKINNFYHYENIPNDEVLKIIKNSHVGLLPTYADTYGYSVLEFQSFACPVITTDIRALPEINNDGKGWLIKVKKDEENEAYYQSAVERAELSKSIKEQLKIIIIDILENPEVIKDKGLMALRELDIKNSPEKNASKLLELYQSALIEE